MANVDPTRVGGLEWTQRTKGRLTPVERRRLLGHAAAMLGAYVASRARLATGTVPARARDLSAEALAPPDSKLARVAEDACREQPPSLIGHGYRTWMFGSGLALLDGNAIDPELFYIASLLHDYGMTDVVPGEDFTLRSAERAKQCADEAGVESASIEAAADAIAVHATPGINVEQDGALGVYLQAGAMLDLTGLRAGELTPSYRDNVIGAHPRTGVSADIIARIRAEAAANPDGRMALARRCGMTMTVRLNPLRPR